MSPYKIGNIDNKPTADIVLNIFTTYSIKIIPQFLDVCDECFHYPLASTISSDILAHPQRMIACESTQSSDWYMGGVCIGFYLFCANSFSCCIQRLASCSDLLTVLLKLLSKLLSLIETRSLWLWQSSKPLCYVVILPPAGLFGHVPCCCGIEPRCQCTKNLCFNRPVSICEMSSVRSDIKH